MANEAEQAIYNRLASAPTFHPVSADLFLDDWALDAGDVVNVRAGETDYSVPIYNIDLSWNGQSRAQIQSTGNQERKPLSPLKRKQYYGRSSAKKWVDEQGQTISTEFIQVKDQIGFVVKIKDGEYEVDAAHVVAGINSQDKTSTSYVDIKADYINLNGYVRASEIEAEKAVIDQLISRSGYSGKLYVGDLSVTSTVGAQTVAAGYVQGSQLWLLDGNGERETRITGAGVTRFGTATPSGGQISIPFFTYESGNTQAGTINFNIADTAYYQNHVGVDSISSSGGWKYSSENGYYNTITATGKDGTTKSADIWPPYITVVPSLGTTATGSVVAQGPDSHNISSPISLYLQSDNDYTYITKDNNTPVAGTNVVARIANSGGSSGISSVVLNGPATGPYSDGTDKGTLTRNRYYQVVATPNEGSSVAIKFKVPESSASADFTTASSLPSGKTATNLRSGYLYRFRFIRDGQTITTNYYRCQ